MRLRFIGVIGSVDKGSRNWEIPFGIGRGAMSERMSNEAI